MDISHAQRGPWSPGRRIPHKVAILPREVSFTARNYQNGLPAPLARDRGAPDTQRGHPATQAVLITRLDQVSLRCWLVTPLAKTARGAHAHDAGAERARGVRVGLGTSYGASPRRQRTWFVHLGYVLRRVRLCGALPYIGAARRASTHVVRACREGAGRPHGPYPPPTNPRSPHRATPLSRKRSLHPCTPPHSAQWSRDRHHPTP